MSREKSSSEAASIRMAKVRQKGTNIEINLRGALYAKGLRYRLQVPVLLKPRRIADIVFTKSKVVVFVDGCFWHGCPLHVTWPKENAHFWKSKVVTNRARDVDTDRRLREMGWAVLRVWGHETAVDAVNRIYKVLIARKRLVD